MTEKSAKDVRGFFLYNPFTHRHFFRVYGEGKKFTDYRVAAENIEAIIHAGILSLYEGEEGNKLDWASKYLRRSK